MNQKDSILVNLPRIMTYTMILLLAVLDIIILISTNRYFIYFEDYKQGNNSPPIGVTQIKKDDVERVNNELESTNKFSQNQDYDTSKMLENNNYTDIFKINYNENEMIKYLSKSSK